MDHAPRAHHAVITTTTAQPIYPAHITAILVLIPAHPYLHPLPLTALQTLPVCLHTIDATTAQQTIALLMAVAAPLMTIVVWMPDITVAIVRINV